MSSKTDKPADKPVPETPHGGAAWRPHVDTLPEFDPFASSGFGGDGRTHFEERAAEPEAIRDATEDTAPLQGTKDLSDADSLEDVVAAAATEAEKPAK